MTTLRNIIGGMDMEAALTSREEINQKLRSVLDEATGKWGIKVNRVELRAIEPPPTIRDAMEKGARAERDKRASILLAEGQRQSQILAAGGDRESAILRAQGDREAAVLRAQADRQAQMLRSEGEAQAITTVFNAIHAGQPDQGLLAYQYMQMLPTLARGDANKVWIVPSELNDALRGLGQMVGDGDNRKPAYHSADPSSFEQPKKVDVMAEIAQQKEDEKAQSDATVQQAIEEAAKLENPALGGSAKTRPTPSVASRISAEQQAQGPMGGVYQTGWGNPASPDRPSDNPPPAGPQQPGSDQPFNPQDGPLAAVSPRDPSAGDQLAHVEDHQWKDDEPHRLSGEQHGGHRQAGGQGLLGAAELNGDPVRTVEPQPAAQRPAEPQHEGQQE